MKILQTALLRLLRSDIDVPRKMQDVDFSRFTLVGKEAEVTHEYLDLIYLIGRFFCWT